MSLLETTENFFPKNICEQLITKIDNLGANWAFCSKNPTYSTKNNLYQNNRQKILTEDVSYFQYKIFGDGANLPDLEVHDLFRTYICKQFTVSIEKIIRINCNISMPAIDKENEYTIPHVDINLPHFSFVYYLNDSDGDTIFFDRFHSGIPEEVENIDDMNIVKRITPKQNSCVLFNGLRYHAVSPSKTQLRKIININFI